MVPGFDVGVTRGSNVESALAMASRWCSSYGGLKRERERERERVDLEDHMVA